MAASKMSALITVVLMVLVATTTTKVAEGQGTPACASNLVPCASYLNSTKPPPSCCTPLKEAVTTQLDCLCKLYENPALLAAFKINITQALELPARCGIPGDVSACKAQAPGSSSSEPPPAQSGGKDNNGVGKIAGSGLTSLLLVLASLMLS